MAKKFAVSIDLQQNELLNARVQNLSTAPSTPVEGQIYWNTATKRFEVWNGTAFGFTAALADNATNLGGNNSAFHLSRANHTGTQTSSTISDFTEAVVDAAGAALTSGTHTGITATYGATQDTANRIDLSVTDSPLLGGQTLAQVRARSSHTGTQTASTISDFDTQVRTSRLDQMAAPTADLNLNSRKITGLATGTALTDAVNLQQLQDAKNQVDRKDSVRVASPTNVPLSAPGGTIDGITMNTGDSFLAYAQTTASENGIYVWNGSGVAATRRSDADSNSEVTAGLTTVVEEGTMADKRAILTTNNPITLGTTALNFTFESTGETIIGGAGLTKTGGTIDVGAGTGISVGTDTVSIDTAVVVRKASVAFGDGAATSYVITHNLNTQDVTVAVYRNSGAFDEVECDVEHTSVNTITLRFSVAPTSNQYRVVVHG